MGKNGSALVKMANVIYTFYMFTFPLLNAKRKTLLEKNVFGVKEAFNKSNWRKQFVENSKIYNLSVYLFNTLKYV